jgi:SAM-dependent methyltransferase
MSTNERSIAWYNSHAAGYTAHVRNPDESIYHSLYEKPAMYSMLPELQDKTVISLGCGSGEDCNYLRKQGAAKMHGIDISEEMIAIANASYPECDFQVMDMEHLTFLDGSFDFAYSSLAIHYIEDWRQVFKEVRRILRPGSFFLFSCNHPVYSAMHTVSDDGTLKKAELSRTRNRQTNQVQIVGDYLSRQAIHQPDSAGMAVTTWHKPIGEISREAVEAGFVIAELQEPRPLLKMRALSPIDYDTLVKIPNFAIFKLLAIS